MTIQQAVEKAIEGGYMKAKDYFGYIPSVFKEVHYNKPEKLHQGHNFFERTSGSFHFGSAKKYSFSISVNEIFLDPLFWQSLGKAMGWDRKMVVRRGMVIGNFMCEDKGQIRFEGPEMGCGMDYLNPWVYYWHRFIDHLAEGKDAESFFEAI